MKVDKHYTQFVRQIKAEILTARISAARQVNRELILLYWQIGHTIVVNQEKHGWGKAVVEQLAIDIANELKGLEGFSARNLWFMRQFYVEYSNPAILKQAVSEFDALLAMLANVPWGHHIMILQKVKNAKERFYYLQSCVQYGWTRNILLHHVKSKSYQRQLKDKKANNFKIALPEQYADQADQILKSSYNLEFLGLNNLLLEKELEGAMVEKIKNVILELGYGFCFIGNQHRLSLGKKDYFIDLLFFHRKLKCLVAIDLKIGEFQPEYAGKMNFYLNLLDAKEKDAEENASIGIILCADKNHLEVDFALKGIQKPIGVADYYLTKTLPKVYKGEIPNHKELELKIKSVLANTKTRRAKLK